MQMCELIIGFIYICTLALLCTFGHLTPEPAKLGIFELFGPLDHPNYLSKVHWEIFFIPLKIPLLDMIIAFGNKDLTMWFPSW